MIKKLEEYKEKIENWAEERGIYDVPDHYKQLLKLGEEFSELLVALNKEDKTEEKDAIGDIFVCIVNIGNFLDTDVLAFIQEDEKSDIKIKNIISVFTETLLHTKKENTFSLKVLVYSLHQYCINNNIDFLECVDLAWNTIKDRKGRMVNGKFVKEE